MTIYLERGDMVWGKLSSNVIYLFILMSVLILLAACDDVNLTNSINPKINADQLKTLIDFDGDSCVFSPDGGGYVSQGGGYVSQGGGYVSQGGGYVSQGGGYVSQGGGYVSQGGGYVSQGGGYVSQGGALVPNGSGYVSQGGGFGTHGEFVRRTLEVELASQGFETDLSGEKTGAEQSVYVLIVDQFSAKGHDYQLQTTVWQRPNPLVDGKPEYIHLVDLDIGDFEIDGLADQIAAEMEALRAEADARKFVLNMSWVILPCTDDGFLPTSIDDYVSAVCRIDSQTDLDDIENLNEINNFLESIKTADLGPFCLDQNQFTIDESVNFGLRLIRTRLVQNWFDSGEYATWAAGLETTSQLGILLGCYTKGIYDADTCSWDLKETQLFSNGAAGNASDRYAENPIKVEYPFAPALWSSVNSISAEEAKPNGDGVQLANVSNSGEVKISGLHPDYEDQGGFTSFATPRFSIESAKFLNQASFVDMTCGNSEVFPTLGYQPEAKAQFLNLQVYDAAEQFCNNDWIIR